MTDYPGHLKTRAHGVCVAFLFKHTPALNGHAEPATAIHPRAPSHAANHPGTAAAALAAPFVPELAPPEGAERINRFLHLAGLQQPIDFNAPLSDAQHALIQATRTATPTAASPNSPAKRHKSNLATKAIAHFAIHQLGTTTPQGWLIFPGTSTAMLHTESAQQIASTAPSAPAVKIQPTRHNSVSARCAATYPSCATPPNPRGTPPL